MFKKALILSLICLLAWNCKKDPVTTSLPSFHILVIQGVYKASLIWDEISPAPSEPVSYSLFLGDSLVSDSITARNYVLPGLQADHEYSGRIEVFSGKNKVGESAFSFKTEVDKPPLAFEIREVAAGPGSVSLRWTQSLDPENTKVVYDLRINGQLRVSGISGLSGSVAGLSPNKAYTVLVEARDSAQNKMAASASFATPTADKSLLVHRFIDYQGIKRDFGYYVPSTYDSASPIPLVIYLHGANGHGWNELLTSYFRQVAEREGFILAMPQALLGTYNGETIYQWNAHYIFSWDDAGFLDYIINYGYSRYNLDLSRVYISGMSNGGFMTFFAGRGLEDRIAAIAPISGLISANVFADYRLKRPVPLCYMHGTADSIVLINSNPSAAEIISFWADNNHCSLPPEVIPMSDLYPDDNSTVTLNQYTGYQPDSEIQYYIIEGGGHSVPGVEPGANRDINAFEVIWSFFKRHSYPAHAPGSKVDTRY